MSESQKRYKKNSSPQKQNKTKKRKQRLFEPPVNMEVVAILDQLSLFDRRYANSSGLNRRKYTERQRQFETAGNRESGGNS
jgi:hypothetical protein